MTLYSYMLEARERGLEVEEFFRECENACVDAQGNRGKSELQRFKLQEMAWKQNINTAYSSSMGRLFDATAALLDICHFNSYEGECAIMLEQAAHTGKQEIVTEKISEILKLNCIKIDGVWQADSTKFLIDIYNLKKTYSKEQLAYLFHHAVADAIVDLAKHICEENDIKQIALSGGTFINRILFGEVIRGLREQNKDVYINEKVPCGDGGIALGQIYLSTFVDYSFVNNN